MLPAPISRTHGIYVDGPRDRRHPVVRWVSNSLGAFAFLGYLGVIPLANWLITHYPPVPVTPGWWGPPLLAPPGVFAAGLALSLRDVVRERFGAEVTWVVIGVGTLFAALVSGNGALALASGVAFAFSEAADALVYEPLRRRGWVRAVLLSGIVGLLLDSGLFLWLAFGDLSYFWGQVAGKLWVTLAAIGLVWGMRWLSRILPGVRTRYRREQAVRVVRRAEREIAR